MQIKVKVHGILLFTIRHIYIYSRWVCIVLCIFAYLTRHYMEVVLFLCNCFAGKNFSSWNGIDKSRIRYKCLVELPWLAGQMPATMFVFIPCLYIYLQLKLDCNNTPPGCRPHLVIVKKKEEPHGTQVVSVIEDSHES